MALLHFMGFDHFSQTSQALDIWLYPGWTATTQSNNYTSTAGLLGGFYCLSSGSNDLVYTLGSNATTLIVGMRVKTTTSMSNLRNFLNFTDGSGIQMGLAISAANRIILWKGTNATVVATGATTTFSANNWYFIEVKIFFDNSGTYEVKVGGVTEFSGSSDTTNTANAYASVITFSLSSSVSGGMAGIDDIYICDGTGSSPTNDFLGVIRVETTFVTSNDSVQWTPLSSTNASQVDEIPVDGDTTYNSDSTSGHIDLFNHGALTSTPTTIFGVAVVSKARKDDVAARSYRNKLKSGATTVSGASVLMDTTYKWIRDQYNTDPDTGVAWASSTAVNATKIGYEHV